MSVDLRSLGESAVSHGGEHSFWGGLPRVLMLAVAIFVLVRIVLFAYNTAVWWYKYRMWYSEVTPVLYGWRWILGQFGFVYYEKFVNDVWAIGARNKGKLPNYMTGGPFLIGNRFQVLCTHPDDVRHILMQTKEHPKEDFLRQIAGHLLGDGLVTSEGDLWHGMRHLLTPLFHFSKLKRACSTVMDQIELSVKHLEEHEVKNREYFHVQHFFEAVTLRVIIAIAFGGDFDIDWMHDNWTAAIDSFQSFAIGRIVMGGLFELTPWGRRHVVPVMIMRERVRKLIVERRKQLDAAEKGRAAKKASAGGEVRRTAPQVSSYDVDPPQDPFAEQGGDKKADNDVEDDEDFGTDLLTAMMRVKTADGKPAIEEKQLIDESLTFLLAGHETSSTTLTWAVYFLGRENPEAQEKARKEVAEVLKGRVCTEHDLPHLVYCRAILEEVLRLRPPAQQLGRQVTEDMTLPTGLRLHKGDSVSAYLHGVHTNGAFWEDPLAFRPERFIGSHSRHAFQFLPFSGGPRNCIGSKFAMQESVLCLSLLLQKYRFDVDPDCEVSMISRLTLQAAGLRARFVPLEESTSK